LIYEKQLYELVDVGINKNLRLYNFKNVSVEHILCSELSIWFNNLLKKNINLYFLYNIPASKIKLSEEDLNYLRQSKKEFYKNDLGVSSKNIELIKEYQLQDFWKINSVENLAIWIVLPYLDENDQYYYNLLVGLGIDGKISDFLGLNFNLIKVNKIEFLNNKISYEFFCNLFNYKNFIFKNNELNKKELKSLHIDQEEKALPEYSEYTQLTCQYWIKLDSEMIKNPSKNIKDVSLQSSDLQGLKEKLDKSYRNFSEKKETLYKYKLLWDYHFKKLSYHIYWDSEKIEEDMIIGITSFKQLGDELTDLWSITYYDDKIGEYIILRITEFFMFKNLYFSHFKNVYVLDLLEMELDSTYK
jgi:hypothetical protein